MDEDQLMKEVLDKFVNCHEQTYEEFLSTFTHLSKEDNVAKGGAHGTDSSENIFPVEKWTQKNESNGHHFRNTTIFLHTSSEGSEEDQVDNFIDLEDLDSEEESKSLMNQDRLLLPGEAEQAIPTCVSYAPSVDLPLTSEVKLTTALRRTQKQAEEIVGDEVQPFFLDEEFDYDNVTLTPKFTAGEIATIQELSKQKRMDTSADLCDPPD